MDKSSRMYRYENFVQVNKTIAKIMFSNGSAIHIIPNNLNINSYHNLSKEICKEDSREDFDTIIKAYIASDCINGCGTYPHYFYDKKKEKHER